MFISRFSFTASRTVKLCFSFPSTSQLKVATYSAVPATCHGWLAERDFTTFVRTMKSCI